MSIRLRVMVGLAAAITIAAVAYLYYSEKSNTELTTEPYLVKDSAPIAEISKFDSVVIHQSQPAPTLSPDIEVGLDFPSGEIVEVTLRNFRPAETPVPIKPRLIDMYDDLVAFAEDGDGASARYLNRSLRDCRSAFRNESDKNAAIDRLRKTGEITYPDGAEFQHQHVPAGRDFGVFIEVMEEQYVACQEITDEQIDEAEYWLDEAINAGDFLATRDHAAEMGVHTPAGFEVQQDLWEQGHVNGLNGLGIAYGIGIPGHNNGQPDYVKSYAYSYATVKIFEGALGKSNLPSDKRRLLAFDEMLSEKGSYLSPEQQREAIDLAAQLLRENEKCCLGMWK